MTNGPARIVFNHYTLPAAGAAPSVYSNDPVVQLDQGQEFLRTDRQRNALQAGSARRSAQAVPASIFGASIEWAYREYIVHRLDASGQGGALLGTLPPQPVARGAREAQLANIQVVDRPPTAMDTRLCLFNVLAATEWNVSADTLEDLAWAFRRASDFLYDATDGRMAFGQVVVGGPELLDSADIQIMASNRLNPRTWVSGLVNGPKYMAIRVGRGAWHKNNRVSIPWDEPEAYRTLVHEWCHYALELPDEYLEAHHVYLPAGADGAHAAPARLARVPYTLVVPGISLATESIMGTLEGTSELVPLQSGGQQRVWDIVKEKGKYTFLDNAASNSPLLGPGRLPLPLPAFHTFGAPASTAPEELRMALPSGMDAGHCWVYVLHGSAANPDRVLAQGTLDARAPGNGFTLLGAHVGDTVVLIGTVEGALQVWAGSIAAASGNSADILDWHNATPPAASGNLSFPVVDVIPGSLNAGQPDERIAQISVRVLSSANARPAQVSIFPHGQLAATDALRLGAPTADDWTSQPQSVSSLDGHVLLSWGDGSMVLYTYSQGGGPATHIPPGPPSISAGSSEGNIMMFFEREQQGRTYEHIRVVTTLLHGMPSALPNGAQARSYTFSVAGNAPLPTDLNPTVVMYFDIDASTEGGDLVIYRMGGDGSWQAMPTYQPAGSSFVAMPLQLDTGSALVSLLPAAQRIERYRMFWVPRA